MELLLVILLIILNGIFAMSEMALVSSKKSRLQQLFDKGSIGAAKAMTLQENPAYFLSSIQVGITTISILSGIVGEKSLVEPTSNILMDLGLSASAAKPVASVTVIVFLTFLSVVFGEIIPKRIGLVLPEKVASVLSIPMSWVAKAGFPIVWLFKQSSECIMRLFGLHKIQKMPTSNEEIKELMEQGAEAGVFHESEQQIVANVLHMDEKRVDSIMTHRGELFYIDLDNSFEENITKIVQGPFSRIVIVKGNIDNILGILHITDILTLLKANKPFKFEEYMEAPLYLPETITATQVLENFKRRKTEVSIIVNEYGENVGIVTLVDIMEAIVGDIAIDNGEQDPEIQMRQDGSFLIDGRIGLEKLAQHLELEKEDFPTSEGIKTLGGLIMEKAGAIPQPGYKTQPIIIHNMILEFEVVDMDKNIIDKAIMVRKPLIEENTVQAD